jgi:hypothetical protein
MEPAFPGLSLVPVPWAAHASIESGARRDIVPPTPGARPAATATAEAAPDAASAESAVATPRRSVLVREKSPNSPLPEFSTVYRVVGLGRFGGGNCLAGTGTRIRRDSRGIGACTIGHGRVYVPER